MALPSANTNLIVLITSIIIIYMYYPQYINIIAPLFIVITLYYSNNDMLQSMLSYLPKQTIDFIINNKKYIIVGLSLVAAYFTINLIQPTKKIDSKPQTIIINVSDVSDLPETSSSFMIDNSDLDMNNILEMDNSFDTFDMKRK
jgi:hypothetical protein